MRYFRKLKGRLFAEITTVPVALQDSYYPFLDGLRGVAILMVILYHFGANHYLRPLNILINSDFGVDIFFVISGFLITTLLLKEKVKYGSISFKRFFTRRALRILPAAYLFLIVIIILKLDYCLKISSSDFLASFLFFKNFPYLQEPYTGHFWSLAAEVQFYLIFPILLAYNINRYMVIIFVIVTVVPVVAILSYYHMDFLYANHFLRVVTKVTMYLFWKGPFIVLIGSLVPALLFKGFIKTNQRKGFYFSSFILFLIAIIINSKSFVCYNPYLSKFMAAILVAAAIVLSLGRKSLLSRILSNRALVQVGIISYSLYLWHAPFLGRQLWQPWLQFLRVFPPYTFIIIKLVLVFLIAFASYYLVEVKFLKIKTKYER